MNDRIKGDEKTEAVNKARKEARLKRIAADPIVQHTHDKFERLMDQIKGKK